MSEPPVNDMTNSPWPPDPSVLQPGETLKFTAWCEYRHWHIYADCPQLAGQKIVQETRATLLMHGLRKEHVCPECMARRKSEKPINIKQAIIADVLEKNPNLERHR